MASDEGWAALASVGQIITQQALDFDSRTWGYPKLSDLVEATTLFGVECRSPGDGKKGILYIRDKRSTATQRKR